MPAIKSAATLSSTASEKLFTELEGILIVDDPAAVSLPLASTVKVATEVGDP